MVSIVSYSTSYDSDALLVIVVTYSRQLAGVVAVGVWAAAEPRRAARHRVQSLGQVRGPLEDNLLGQPLGVPGVARHQLGQPAESVVYTRLLQG